jgi:uncharacterized protein (DUF58 family)
MLDIQEIRKKVRQIEIKTRKAVNEVLAGEYHSTFKGQGMEFSDVRPYQPGDDYRSIDWNVTARTGSLHIKQFHEERERTLLLAVDVSGSLRFGTASRLKSESLAELAALLAFSAIRSQDRVGLLLFSDRTELFIPPRKGVEHVLRLVREILYFEPRGRGTDFPACLATISRLVPRRATVFLCSDFQAPLGRGLPVLARRHDLSAVYVEDPAELDLPSGGWTEWEDPETGRYGWAWTGSASLRRRFRETRLRQKQVLLQSLRRANVDTLVLSTSGDVAAPLVRFLRSRPRGRAA